MQLIGLTLSVTLIHNIFSGKSLALKGIKPVPSNHLRYACRDRDYG